MLIFLNLTRKFLRKIFTVRVKCFLLASFLMMIWIWSKESPR